MNTKKINRQWLSILNDLEDIYVMHIYKDNQVKAGYGLDAWGRIAGIAMLAGCR